MSDPQNIETGQIINDRYEVEARLGAGGFSDVVAATDRLHRRPVALKILRNDALTNDPKAAARLRQEAQILQAINHRNIVRVYDVDSFDGGHFMVMERIEGQGLDALLANGQTLAPHRLLSLVRQILAALQAAHAHQVLHRDLKPENILLTPLHGAETAKLVDFGIAKAEAILNADDPDEGITLVKTQTGSFVGTPRYSAPEMIVGDPTTPASDLFCLGLVTYEALMGRPLISATTHNEVINQLVFPRPFDLSDVPHPWHQWLEPVVEKSPDYRFQTVEEAAQLLDELFGGQTDLRPSTETAPTDHRADIDELYPSFGDDGDADRKNPTINKPTLETAQWQPADPDELAREQNRQPLPFSQPSQQAGPPPEEAHHHPKSYDGSPRELLETRPPGEGTDTVLLFVLFALLAFVIAGSFFL